MGDVGFLFDNDGVLIDSRDLHWQSWIDLMKEDASFNITFDQFLSGFGKRNLCILKELSPDKEDQHVAWAVRKEELFRKIAKDVLKLLPGMEVFLKEVVKRHIPRIIASSTPVENLRMFLRDTPIGLYFTDFVSGDEVEHGKPAPDIFLAAAKKIGKDPQQCIVFEDAQVGIDAGKGAGCFVVALATTYCADELKNYDLIYADPTELDLDEILKKFKNRV